ncbi:MAG: hypothetical protein IIZ44_07575 [Muribaculaceae bacterium]|nr:hypothetical protein [Muribaculaceae bacterium]
MAAVTTIWVMRYNFAAMKGQKERLALAQHYVIEAPNELPATLDAADQRTVEILRKCYNYLVENPLASYKDRRDYLVKEMHVSINTAYDAITICNLLLGDTTRNGKNLAKIKVQSLLDEAYKCLRNDDYKGADGRIKLAQTYIKAFRLDVDEGEMVDAKAALNIEAIRISTDPTTIGITKNTRWRSEVSRLMKMYGVEDDYHILDVEAEEVTDQPTPESHEESLPASGAGDVSQG